jgi:hypothetical protein
MAYLKWVAPIWNTRPSEIDRYQIVNAAWLVPSFSLLSRCLSCLSIKWNIDPQGLGTKSQDKERVTETWPNKSNTQSHSPSSSSSIR